MNSVTRLKAIIYALALVVLGGVIGYVWKSATPSTPQSLRVGRVEEIEVMMRERLYGKLGLTPVQQQKIEPLIKKAAEEMEASHLNCLKQINQTVNNLHAAIKAELTPEQQAKLAELDTERTARMLQKYNYRLEANAGQPPASH